MASLPMVARRSRNPGAWAFPIPECSCGLVRGGEVCASPLLSWVVVVWSRLRFEECHGEVEWCLSMGLREARFELTPDGGQAAP